MPTGLGWRRSVDLPPLKERLVALRIVPRFLRMVWRAQPYYATAIVSLRLVLASSPVLQLWIGKLIIDVGQHRLRRTIGVIFHDLVRYDLIPRAGPDSRSRPSP